MSMIKHAGSLLLVVAVAGAACHKRTPVTAAVGTTPAASATPTRTSAPPPADARAARPAAAVPSSAAPLTEAELFARKSLGELNDEHPLGDVFFDYNETTLREDAKHVLQQDAQWLAKWPQTM